MLWLICCFSSLSFYGQTTITGLDKDYTQRMDEIIVNVNKTPITTGILYDRIMSFSNLNWLKENGVVTKSNYKHFIQSWSELHNASYNPTFSSLETLKTNINTNTNTSIVYIGIINTKMNYIDYGTTTQPSLNTVNGLLYNVANINPFLEKQITIVSPLKEKVTANSVTFRIEPAFILQQTGLSIKNLVANFGTTTNYNLISNSVVSTSNPTVTYSTSGLKEFTFTITYSNNTTETVKASMDIIVENNNQMAMASPSSFPLEEDFVNTAGITTTTTGNIAFQGYNETTATKGVLEYRTYYNLVTNNGSAKSKINKEIIILDGYDPGDGRKIYPGSLNYDDDKSSLYELMSYDDDNNPSTIPANLVEKLRSAPYGFDVTLVNFPNGADYVERNAMALVSLLQRENDKLETNGSTEQISIVGPSMGGLVSRYALAYMEKNNLVHNTRLWVSFDSPHLGANIPIGAQENLYFYGYNGRKDDAKIKFDENFRSPAARQMLIEQLDGKHEAFPYPTSLWGNSSPNGQNNNTPFRQQFQNNLNTNGTSGSNGYPQNLRKIALINGTTNGTTTNNAGNKFLELAAFTIIKYGQIFGTPIQTKIKVATINDSFLQNTGGYGQTFSGKVTIKRTGGIEVQNGSVNRTNSNPRGLMDMVQGGTFNTQGIIKDEFTLVLNDEVDSQEWRTYLPNHAFIPSVSALAFKNPNFNWANAININLVCDPLNKEIYFDSYFTPNNNEKHVFISAENANWLIKELTGNPQAPYFHVQENALVGASHICKDVNSTYTFDDVCKIPSAVIYDGNTGWSVEGNLAIVSFTEYSVIVKGTSDEYSSGIIKARFQNGYTLEKEIIIGKPTYTSQPIQNGYDNVSVNSSSNLKVNPPLGAKEYYWTIIENSNSCGCYTTSDGLEFCPSGIVKPKFPNGSTYSYTSSSTWANINWGNCKGTYIVNCYSKNECGLTPINHKVVTVYSNTGGGFDPCEGKLVVFPNPINKNKSNDEIVVNLIYPPNPCDNPTVSGKAGEINNEVKIYDFYGTLLFSQRYNSDDFKISNLSLKPGNYILNVFTSKGFQKKEIIFVE